MVAQGSTAESRSCKALLSSPEWTSPESSKNRPFSSQLRLSLDDSNLVLLGSDLGLGQTGHSSPMAYKRKDGGCLFPTQQARGTPCLVGSMHGENSGGQTGAYRRLGPEAKGKCGDGSKTLRMVIPILATLHTSTHVIFTGAM